MFNWLRKWLTVRRPVTTHKRGSVAYTHTGLHLAFSPSFVFGAPVRKPTARKAAPPRRSRLLDWAFGAPPPPPLADAEARKLPLVPDRAAERRAILAEAERLTGTRYAGRTTLEDARAVAARMARLTAMRRATQAKAKVVLPKHVKPVYVRQAKNGREAHWRALPGKGTTK
jgi:hypothetical protein